MRKTRFKGAIVFLLSLLVITILTVLYAYVWKTYYLIKIPLPFGRRGNYLMYALYMVLAYLFTRLYGARKIGDWTVGIIVYSQMLSAVMVNVCIYLIVLLINRGYITFLPMIYLTVMDFAAVIVWAVFAKLVYQKINPPRRMILVYADRDPDMLFEKMSRRRDKYNICEYINVSRGLEAVKKTVLDYDAVILCDIPSEQRNDLVKYCFEKELRAYVTPKLSDVILMGADNSNVFDFPLLICKNREMGIEKAFAKRTLDLVLIVPVCIVSAPVMLLLALLIKCFDRGPVFSRQKCLTLNGRVFEQYRFCSARAADEDTIDAADKRENRSTPVGGFLRRIHLDGLPQMYNVLKGEMSIVGPHPERPEMAARYKEFIPEYDFRLRMKAGLTGYAQVHGRFYTTPYDQLKLDLFYIEHQSFLLDLELIMMAVKVMFMRKRSEKIENWQVTTMPDEDNNSSHNEMEGKN